MEIKEGSMICLLNILEYEEARKVMVLNNELLDFFIGVMKDSCRVKIEQRKFLPSYHAAKAAHLLCVPVPNADRLCLFRDGAFVETLVDLVMADCETWSAACGLCHLANNNDIARNLLSCRPAFIDVLAKTALSNPDGAIAAEALSKLLPNMHSSDTFKRIVRLMTIRSNFCMNAAIEAILERMSSCFEARFAMTTDKNMTSILIDMTRNHKNTYVMSQATKALMLMTLEDQCKDKMRSNQDLFFALSAVISSAKIGESSKSRTFHESAAYATVALCNLCVDGESDGDISAVLMRHPHENQAHGFYTSHSFSGTITTGRSRFLGIRRWGRKM